MFNFDMFVMSVFDFKLLKLNGVLWRCKFIVIGF